MLGQDDIIAIIDCTDNRFGAQPEFLRGCARSTRGCPALATTSSNSESRIGILTRAVPAHHRQSLKAKELFHTAVPLLVITATYQHQ